MNKKLSSDSLSRPNEIMDYSFPSAAWSDCHSNFCVSWPEADQIGLQWLQSLRIFGGVVLTHRLLGWHLDEDGQHRELDLVRRDSYPERIIELASASDMEVATEYSWIERNTLHLNFTLNNTGTEAHNLQFVFDYENKGLDFQQVGGVAPRKRYEADRRSHYSTGLCPMEGEKPGSWQMIVDFEKDPEAPLPENYKIEGKAYVAYCITDLSDRSFRLGPGEEASFEVILALGHAWHETRERFLKHNTPSQWKASIATQRVRKLLENAPEIDPDFQGHEGFERLYAQAICGLNSLYIQGENGFVGDKRVPWTCKNTLTGGYFWDTAFSSTGGVYINPEAAKESIEAFCMNVNHRGAMPANVDDLYMGGEGQFPILTRAAWHIYSETRDISWLKRIETSLHRHIEYWFKYHGRESGIGVLYSTALGNDNDARFDHCMKGHYNRPVFDTDTPDVNALLVIELRALAKIDEVLGNPEKAEILRKRADKLNQQIIDHFYFPEDRMFWDVVEGTRQIRSGTITPFLFFPLQSEVPLQSKEIKDIIEKHMLNPETFFQKFPYPSLAYNHPEYDPEGYWRGRIWPHVVFWMAQILWMHGYRKESTQVAHNLLKMMLQTPWICENYNSQTGAGWSAETIRGWPGFAWCYSTVILLMTGKHKLPPLPELSS